MKMQNLLAVSLMSAVIVGCGGGTGNDNNKPVPTPDKTLKDAYTVTVNDGGFLQINSNHNGNFAAGQKVNYMLQILLADGSSWMALGETTPQPTLKFFGGAYFKGSLNKDKLTVNAFKISLWGGNDNITFDGTDYSADYVTNGTGKFTVSDNANHSADFNLSAITANRFTFYAVDSAHDKGSWRIKDEMTNFFGTLTYNADQSFTATFDTGDAKTAGTPFNCKIVGQFIGEKGDEFFRPEFHYEGAACNNLHMAEDTLALKGAGFFFKDPANANSATFTNRSFYLIATSEDGRYTRLITGNKYK